MKSGNYLDNLQRLIGMFFQYGMENLKASLNEDGKIVPAVREKILCLVCGSEYYNSQIKETKRGYKYWITCTECYHIYNI